MQRFQIFWHNLQQDLKIFLYFTILFSVFRLIFIGIFNTYLSDCTMQDILLCQWYGFRLSLGNDCTYWRRFGNTTADWFYEMAV